MSNSPTAKMWQEAEAKGWSVTRVMAARTCRRKIKYADGLQAMRAAIELGAGGDWCVGFHSYRCPHCQGYHVGHKATPATLKRFRHQLGREVIAKFISRVVARQGGSDGR